jgi:hypothetical protein
VSAESWQSLDGSIGHVDLYLGNEDAGLTGAQARELAAALITAADEMEKWPPRHGRGPSTRAIYQSSVC